MVGKRPGCRAQLGIQTGLEKFKGGAEKFLRKKPQKSQ